MSCEVALLRQGFELDSGACGAIIHNSKGALERSDRVPELKPQSDRRERPHT